tara:strand:- start:210 stop:623 length:414 start_codon:yes stop_codon:yes gene_type:complete
MTKLFSLKGKIQNYAWGGTQFIPNLLGIEPSNEKCAEYWLGDHVNAPSVLKTKEGEQTLNTFLNSDLKNTLGQNIADKFGRLSFLFKVLDVMTCCQSKCTQPKQRRRRALKEKTNWEFHLLPRTEIIRMITINLKLW